ncbi:hypothetical protein [Kitasatospora sp. NPDC004289]
MPKRMGPFFAYPRGICKGFVTVQRWLAASDALNECIRHVGSAQPAYPPGVRKPGVWWGKPLLG